MKNNIVVFDFETISADPETTEPCQLGAVIINPTKLEIVPGSEFNSNIRVLTESKIQEGALKVIKRTREDVLQGPEPEVVWKNFLSYLQRFYVGKNKWGAPIPGGHNIINFDIPIARRMSEIYAPKSKDLFHPIHTLDTMTTCFWWLENNHDVEKFNLDYLRDFFGASAESKANAHDALSDVKDCAQFIIRFLNLHRKLNKNISFKDAFLKPMVS